MEFNEIDGLVPELFIDSSEKIELEETFVFKEPNTLKKHIFRINSKNRTLFTEVFEDVTGLESETIRLSLCVPLAIGCAMNCRMCDLGTFYGGELPKEVLLQLIERVVGVHTVAWKNPSRLKISYLGGGEPAYNKDVPETVKSIAHKYPGCTQVISTVGVANDFNNRFIGVARDLKNVGFQISVYGLDDDVRNYIVNHDKILNVDQCIGVIRAYHKTTGRKGRIVLVLLEGMYDDLNEIKRQIMEKLDVESFHISLQTFYDNSTGFPHKTLPLTQYKTFKEELEGLGYTATIYNPRNLQNLQGVGGGCGVASDRLLSEMALYKKRR